MEAFKSMMSVGTRTALALTLAVGLAPQVAFADELAASESAVVVAQGESALASQAASYDASFAFSEDGVAATSGDSGYKISGTELTINAPGTYYITGSCSEGNIKVKKGTTGVVLVLENLTLSCSSTAPLAINKDNGDTNIQVYGTVSLTDAEDPANEDSEDADIADAFEGAALKVKSGSNATITGTGTLTADGSACKNGIKGASGVAIAIEDGVTVNAYAANNGIASDGSVVVNGGTINVDAVNDGIKAAPEADDADSVGTVTIAGGVVNVKAGDDGIKADPDDGNTVAQGTTSITGGTVIVNAGDDGIKAYGALNIGTQGSATGPSITVASSTEGLEAATLNLLSGSGSITASDDGVNAANKTLSENEDASLFDLNISGGTWTVDAGGDGLDSNGNITITGGDTVVYGPTQGGNGVFDYAENGGTFSVTGGTLLGLGVSDMALTPTSGTYVVFGNGAMGGGMPGAMGGGTNGGTNGSWQGGANGGRQGGMGGGSWGGGMPGSMGAQAADGESTDAQSTDELSAQAFNGSSYSISAGQVITVTDSSGNVVASTTAAKNAQWVLYASSDLQEGQTYTLNSGSSQLATATAQTGSTAGGQGGMTPWQPGNGTQPSQSGDGTQPSLPGDGTLPWQPGDGTQPSQPGDGTQPSLPTDGTQPGQNLPSMPGTGETGSDTSQPTTDGETSGETAPANGTVMLRLYNPNSGEHFFTASASERDDLVNAGWQFEGEAWIAPASSSTPVYRLYNPYAGDHHYTTSAAERDDLIAAGWNNEGIGWYSYAETEGTPLHRLYNPNAISGAHHYTTNMEECMNLISLGWTYEGIGWYGA